MNSTEEQLSIGITRNFAGEDTMEVLLIAFGALVVIWIVVIVGAPMFGSN